MAKRINKKYVPRWDAGDHFFYTPNIRENNRYLYLVVDTFELDMVNDVPLPFYVLMNINTGRYEKFVCESIDKVSAEVP